MLIFYIIIITIFKYGAVMRGIDLVEKVDIAAKLFKVSLFGTKEEQNLDLIRQKKEANILEKFQLFPHENVINLLEVIDTKTEMYLVFPLMKCSLNIEIYGRKYNAQRTQQVMCMILNGLKHIHEQHIIHRDLKPENILIDCNGVAKICDFGLSTDSYPDQYHMGIYGTTPYIAPEQYLKFGFNEKADIWVVQPFRYILHCMIESHFGISIVLLHTKKHFLNPDILFFLQSIIVNWMYLS